jgi:hypothetical protein
MNNLSQSVVRETLSYSPETGEFVRLKSGWSKRVGMIAGTKDTYGYLQIKVNGRLYLAHRLAWIYMYGEWPEKGIDHRNGIRDDNRIANLRLADQAENSQNQFKAQAEQLRAELSALRDAVRPFVRLVKTTSGRIPTERLSFADWHALAKVGADDTATERPNVQVQGASRAPAGSGPRKPAPENFNAINYGTGGRL